VNAVVVKLACMWWWCSLWLRYAVWRWYSWHHRRWHPFTIPRGNLRAL